MALSATLNKTSYVSGETMTLTVTTAAGERNRDVPISLQVTVEGVGSTSLSGVIDNPDAAVSVSDSSRSWTKQSDNGTVAVFTATA